MADTTQIGFTTATGDGVTSAMRGGRLNDLIVSEHSPRFAEMTIRGRSYSLGLAATTTGVPAGNITGASGAASTNFALWNPLGSNINVVLKRFFFGIVSGSIVVGPLLHNVFSAAVPTIASSGTAFNNLIGQSYTGQAKFQVNAGGTLALAGGSSLTLLRPSTISFGAAATAFAAAAGSAAFEDIDGDIVLAPGTGWVPTFSGAGTALLNSWGITWNEIPI
jgi:hypothetical protein